MEPDPTLAIYDDGSIVKCLHEIQEMIDPPTAIMVGNDYLASSVLMELEKLGWYVSEDMALMIWSRLFRAASRSQPRASLSMRSGQCAAEMLLSLLDPRFVPSRNWWEFASPPKPD